MDVDKDLELFVGSLPEAAGRAFERLSAWSRPRLLNWLRPRTRDWMEAEEIAQDTLVRAWENRHRFHNEGAGQWSAFLRTIAYRLLLDRKIPGAPDQFPDGWDREAPRFEEEVHLALLAERAWWLANLVWLGLDPDLSPEVHDRQLLAATRYYMDGEPLEEIVDSMPSPPFGEPPLTLPLLRRWICCEGVLRYLIFRTLYFSNERLALVVLGLHEAEDGARKLADLAARCSRSALDDLDLDGCPGLVVAVALWRYRSAMTPHQMHAKHRDTLSRWGVTEQQLLEACALLADREPFIERVREIQCAFGHRKSEVGRNQLASDGVWRRLVFQYEYRDDVPMPELIRRVEPPAREVPFDLTPHKINSWTNGKQLCGQLAKYWRKTFGGDFDE